MWRPIPPPPNPEHGWIEFLEKCRVRRLTIDAFTTVAPTIAWNNRLDPYRIADLLLGTGQTKSKYRLDGRFHCYGEVLLKLRIIDAVSLLRVLYRYSTAHNHRPSDSTRSPAKGNPKSKAKSLSPNKPAAEAERWGNSYAQEEFFFKSLTRNLNTHMAVAGNASRIGTLLKDWIELFTDVGNSDLAHVNNPQAPVFGARFAFMELAVAVYENQRMQLILAHPVQKAFRKRLAQRLSSFIATVKIQTVADAQVVQRLETFRTQVLPSWDPREEAEPAEEASYVDTLIGLENFQTPLVPTVNSRAGLYIYLNAALAGRPLIDDHALFGYLHNRYQGDLQATATQLILAAFDVLANSVFLNEGSNMGHLLKSFVVNKVPLILVSLAQSSSAVYPFNAEYCISQALNQVDTNVFPTLSGLFDMNNNSSFQDSVRQDFCFACQLHGLLSSQAIETLLGDITYQSLPDEGRYVKDTLVRSCLEDLEKTQKLIGELDNMNGNAGAAAQAVVEVLVHLCRNKETMSLKRLCTHLSSKPLSLDILLLFNKPQTILQPLCDVLDNWGGYDEDQGEYQPVYEEFGSILLLLLSFVYRYGFTAADLGRSGDSFVGKLLTKGQLAVPFSELTEQEVSHMNGWIHALFDTEAGGLGDDMMAACLPQQFYLLLPTLFSQIVLALSTGNLTEEMVRGGLEYLVDVLLLPSLVPAIMYLSNSLGVDSRSEQPQAQRAVIRVLQLILRPHSLSPEASSMLSSVLNIVAKPLEHALRFYQRLEPKSQTVQPLLMALKENLAIPRRTGAADNNELELWAQTNVSSNVSSNGSGVSTVQQTIRNLYQWAQNSTIDGLPPNAAPYTHRQILAGLQMLGPKYVLTSILSDLHRVEQETPEAAPYAYDVVTAIICAPNVHSTHNTSKDIQTPLSLHDVLKAKADDWKRIQKVDPTMAETVVRLFRRVEAQMIPPPPPPDVVGGAMDGSDGLAMAMAAQADHQVANHNNMDAMSLVDTTGLDGLGSAAGSVVGLDLGGDDIFSGLSGVHGDFGADFGTWDGSMDLQQ